MPPYDATAEPDLLAADEGAAAVQPIVATDGELLMAFSKHRDEAAFAQLVDRHAPLVWSVCHQVLGNRADVEDAFQATFLILATRAQTIRASDSAAAWLYRVAHRTAIALWRDRRKRDTTPLNGHDVVGPEVNPLERLGEQHAVTVLVEELRTLPEKYQSPLVLCYLEGLSRSAAAEALDCTTAAVKGRLARGRRMLRERLARRGVALSVAAAAAATGVASAQTVVASSSVGSVTAAAATGYVSSASSASGMVALAPQVTSLVQQGASAMFYASFAKPALALVAVVAVGVATALAIDEPAPQPPAGDGDFVLQANSDTQPEVGELLDSALSVTTPLASSPLAPSPSGEDARDGGAANKDIPVRPSAPIQAEMVQTGSGEDILVLRGHENDVRQVQQRILQAGNQASDLRLTDTESAQQPGTVQHTTQVPVRPQPMYAPPRVAEAASVQQLEMEHRYWETRAEGLEAKAKIKQLQFERIQAIAKKQPGAISQSELEENSERLADASLLQADAYMAKAKMLELDRRIEQRKQQPQPVAHKPPTPVLPPTPVGADDLFGEPVPGIPRSLIGQLVERVPSDRVSRQVQREGKLVLLHFVAPNSKPCKSFLDMVTNAAEVQQILSECYVVENVDVSKQPSVAKRYGVTRVPTVVVLATQRPHYSSDDQPIVSQFTAPIDAKKYAEKLNQLAMQHAPNRQQRPSHARRTPNAITPPAPSGDPQLPGLSTPKPSIPGLRTAAPDVPPVDPGVPSSNWADSPLNDPPRQATGWQQGPPLQPQTQSPQLRQEPNQVFSQEQPAASERSTLRGTATDPPRLFRDAPQPRSGDPFAPKPDDRPLQPGDSLQVDIRQQWPIPAQIVHPVRLGGGGHLSMAGLDKALKLDGLTLEEAKVAINEALAEQHGEKFQHVGLSATVRRTPNWEDNRYSLPTLIPTTGPNGQPNPAAYRSSPAPQPAQPQPYPSESPYTPSLSSPSPAG